MNLRGEKGFIGINIPQPRDQRLIEQRRLNRALGFGQALSQFPRPNRQRFRPQPRFLRFSFPQPENSPEPARVREANLILPKAQQKMRVRNPRRPRRFNRQPPRHPQMNEKSIPIIKQKNNLLPPPGDRRDNSPREKPANIRPDRLNNIRRKSSTPTTRLPAIRGESVRTTVSTSGNSGIRNFLVPSPCTQGEG